MEFYERHYSSDQMALVILSNYPLDDLEAEVRTLLAKTSGSAHALQQAGEAKKQIEQAARRHWRVFGAPAPSLDIKYAHHGRFPPEVVENWLRDLPPRVFYHGSEGNVTLVLKDRGYRDTGSGVWSREPATSDDSKPVKPKRSERVGADEVTQRQEDRLAAKRSLQLAATTDEDK